ncbi:unnamed protein product [Arctogadus glacialis]
MDCLKLSRSVRRDCQLSPLGKPAIPRVYLLGYCSTQQNPVPTSSPSEGVLLAVSLSYETASLLLPKSATQLRFNSSTEPNCTSSSPFIIIILIICISSRQLSDARLRARPTAMLALSPRMTPWPSGFRSGCTGAHPATPYVPGSTQTEPLVWLQVGQNA